ncbi:MAG: glycoside hydrolase family 28 protein [Prevotella sp.]
MKKLTLLFVLLLLHVTAINAQDYSKYYTNLPVSISQPVAPAIPDNSVNIKDFGGIGDGVTLNTEAFRKAISALEKNGGGRLVVPAGIWITGLISLKDNMELHVEKNAIIMASPDRSLFIKETDGKKDNKCTPLISASKRKNVAITGQGVIDGNGAMWRPVKRSKVSDTEWKEFLNMGGTQTEGGKLWFPYNLKHYDNIASSPEEQEKMRTHLIRITDCENVLVKDITLQNSPKFHLIPTRCKNVIVDGVTIRCAWNAQNGDALDISSCKDVLIVNNTIDAGDDGICMKAGAGKSGLEYGPCENILIENNAVFHAHGGFVIGSEFSGGMTNIIVRNNRFSGTDTGLRFKSGIGRGGITKGIYISDIYMTDIKEEAIIFECSYVDKKYSVKEDAKTKTTTTANAPFAPQFTDIHFSNIVCRNAKTAISAQGLPGLNCVYGITIDNSTFFYTSQDKNIGKDVDISISNCKFLSFEK